MILITENWSFSSLNILKTSQFRSYNLIKITQIHFGTRINIFSDDILLMVYEDLPLTKNTVKETNLKNENFFFY